MCQIAHHLEPLRLIPSLLTDMVCRSQANLEVVLGFELAEEDYDAISDIDFQLRLVDGIRFLRPEGPFRCAHLHLLPPCQSQGLCLHSMQVYWYRLAAHALLLQ